LRSHVRDKGHETKGDDKRWGKGGDYGEGKRDREKERDLCEDRRRPSKRRKLIASNDSNDFSDRGLDLSEHDSRLDLDVDVLHTRIVPY
jgi:hypothetical protein